MTAPFLADLEQVFAWLLAASWQASVLAVLVLLVQRILGARLNPRWRYALWLLVLLRLVLPVEPESALSLFQFAPPPPPALTVTVTEPLFVSQPIPTLPSATADAPEPTRPITFYSLLAVIWLAGALTLLVLTWQVNRRFARQVENSPAISDTELLHLFAEARAELGIRRSIRLIESSQVQSPAIMGLFQPTLLLPTDVRAKFNPRELRLIFLHELAHLKRGDVIAQALIAVLQILHWFNPVLWFAFRRMRIDREPATDALVLSRTGEEEKEHYGMMLIKLLEHFNQRHSLPTLVGILEDKDQFKRRFSLIARFTRGAYGWSLLGIVLIAGLAIACLTKAKEVATAAPEYAHVQVLAIDLPESEYQADRQRIDDIVHNGYFISFLRLPQAREIARSSLGKTTFDHGAGLITSPSGPVLMFQITPTRDQDKIKIDGSMTFERQDWSHDSGKVPNLDLRPVTIVPIASTLTPQHLQAVPPEGILEPDGVRPPRDNQPRRVFLFFTAWAENATSTSFFSSLAALKTQMPVAPVPLPDPFVRSVPLGFHVHDTAVTGTKEDKNEVLLREAIADDDYPGAKKLIEAGVQVRDWNIADAMANKNSRLAKLLWDHTTNRGSEIRYEISQGASVAQVAAMLKQGAPAEPPEDVFIDPLGVAAANGDLPMIQLLLANGADPNWEGVWQGNKVERYTALGIAVGQRRLDIITYLFDHGQKPSDFGAMIGALMDCMKSNPDDQRQISKQIVRLLVARGALDLLPGNRGIYLYIACAEVIDPELVKLLLDHGCNPEEVAIDGQGTAPVIQQVRDAVAGKNNKPPRLELQPILALLEGADKSAGTTTPDASTATSQAEYANWLDHAPQDQKETAAKAFTVADAFLTAVDSGSNVPAPSIFDGTMPTDESWTAYLNGVRTRFGEVQARHLGSVVSLSQSSVIYELSVCYDTTFQKGNAISTTQELVRLARTPPTDPKGEWSEWKVTEFNIFEKSSTGQSSSPVAILSTETERAEAYFSDALEKDHTMIVDSRVKSSTLAADAQMLLAIRKGDVDSLKKVLEHAVDPNTFDPDRFNSSPVYWAVYFDQPEALQMLLEHMAKSSSGPANETPLQLAQKAHPDLVPVLKEGIKHNNEILTTQLKENLHSIHIDMPAFSNEPLQEIVSFLIKAMSTAGYLDRRVGVGNMDVPTSTTFTTPAATNISLWDAIQTIADANKLRFDVDCVDGGDITFYPPKDEARMHPTADITTTPAVNAQKENPALDQALLGIARDGHTDKVGAGDADKVGQLLDQGADANAKDERGTTALVWALNFGKDDAAQLLIKHGADGGMEDANGENAAWLAAKIYYCPGALELMIQKGVNVKGLNKSGDSIFSAMTSAIPAVRGKMNYLHDRVWTDAEFQSYQERERRTVDILLAAGVDINCRSGPESKTPLMLAIQHGHVKMADELIKHGVDVSLKDSNGETAASLAKMYGHPELLPLLEAMPPGTTPGNTPNPAAPAPPPQTNPNGAPANTQTVTEPQKNNALKEFVPPNPLPAQANWTWTTSDGRIFKDVVVERVEADVVVILHEDGGAMIDIATLPPDTVEDFQNVGGVCFPIKAKRAFSDSTRQVTEDFIADTFSKSDNGAGLYDVTLKAGTQVEDRRSNTSYVVK